MFDEVSKWWGAISAPQKVEFSDEDMEFLVKAKELLPDDPFDGGTWGVWTSALKEATGRKGKQLFMPLRRAITGLEFGPELAAVLPIVGRQEILTRLPE